MTEFQVQHNLPAQITSFVGRAHEIAEIGQLLVSSRLLTITGAGGSGKTRLALEVALANAGAYPDGVFFVDLTTLIDPTLIPQAVATALNINEEPDRFLITTLSEHMQ